MRDSSVVHKFENLVIDNQKIIKGGLVLGGVYVLVLLGDPTKLSLFGMIGAVMALAAIVVPFLIKLEH